MRTHTARHGRGRAPPGHAHCCRRARSGHVLQSFEASRGCTEPHCLWSPRTAHSAGGGRPPRLAPPAGRTRRTPAADPAAEGKPGGSRGQEQCMGRRLFAHRAHWPSGSARYRAFLRRHVPWPRLGGPGADYAERCTTPRREMSPCLERRIQKAHQSRTDGICLSASLISGHRL